MTTDRILDRVRKLLNLANDAAATDGERDNALRMAYATLAKHNLDIADVGSGQTQEARERQVAELSVYPWARGISHSIAGLFFCSYFFSRGTGKLARHSFVGKQSNAISAKEMSEYVVASVFKELRQRFRSETSPEARSFAVGVEAALRRRCRELREAAEAASKAASDGRSLVLASLYTQEAAANTAWINANVGKLKESADRTKGVLAGAYRAGKAHGDGISLAPQVGHARSSVKRIG